MTVRNGFDMGFVSQMTISLKVDDGYGILFYQDGINKGYNRGLREFLPYGMSIGEESGIDEGYAYAKVEFFTGISTGGGGSTDHAAPTISVISVPTKTSDPIVINIYDAVGLRFFHLTCKDHSNSPRYTMWDPVDGAFSFPFDNIRSTKTGTGTQSDPYIFTIYRLGGWPTNLNLDIRISAIDTSGNKADS